MNRDRNSIIKLAAIVVFTAVVTFMLTAAAFLQIGYWSHRYDISFQQGSVKAENIKKFNQTKGILEKSYYQSVDDNSLLEGAISGMASALKDPYTVYYNKDQMRQFSELTQKSEDVYVGIGVSVLLDNSGIVVVSEPPFEDSPAQKAGLKQGDKIVKVDDKDVTGLKDESLVVGMIKGKENTNVKVTVFRPSEGKTLDFDMIRKKLKAVLNIRSEMLPDNIGYIRLKVFDNNISSNFKQSLRKLQDQGAKGLMIDLRDNPGGLYDEVVSIARMLVPKGTIVYTQDRQGKKKTELAEGHNIGIPIAVLVNGNSASASEILSGALKDNKMGTLVGTKTFGKGLVQTTYQFDDGTGLKVTIARYFTPSGICIQGIGIQPDIEVKLDDKYKDTPLSEVPKGEDAQLQKGIEVIKNQMK